MAELLCICGHSHVSHNCSIKECSRCDCARLTFPDELDRPDAAQPKLPAQKEG